MNYSGPVRIEVNGSLLTVGTASIDDDTDGGWGESSPSSTAPGWPARRWWSTW